MLEEEETAEGKKYIVIKDLATAVMDRVDCLPDVRGGEGKRERVGGGWREAKRERGVEGVIYFRKPNCVLFVSMCMCLRYDCFGVWQCLSVKLDDNA